MHKNCGQNQKPLLLAESLCVPCAGNAITKSNGKAITSKIWSYVELGIASGRTKHLNKASELIESVAVTKLSTQSRVKFMLLQASMPALQDRAARQPLSQHSRSQTNAMLGEVIISGLGGGDRTAASGLVYEGLSMYLMSRPGMDMDHFLFPGSAREESSLSSRTNHDAYMTWPTVDGLSKYAFSLKASKANGSAYDIPSLSIATCLQPAMKAIGSTSIGDIATLAAFEAMGRSNSYQETALDFAGHCLQTALLNAIYEQQLKATPDVL